jgi:signal transduction histidine kinase
MNPDPWGVATRPENDATPPRSVRAVDARVQPPEPVRRVAEAEILAPYEHAVSATARAFLSDPADETIQAGLNALLDAVDADVVAVVRNVDHHADRPSGVIVHSTTRTGAPIEASSPDPVPWSGSARATDHLAEGASIATRIDALGEAGRALYAGVPSGAVLEVPIRVDGRWLGHLALVDFDDEREWSGSDAVLGSTVSRFIGAAWERERNRERLQRTVQTRDRFISSVNHRLRTPLTALVGASALLVEDEYLTPEERAEFVTSIAEQSLEVAQVIEDLFIAARADIGQVQLARDPVDMSAAVDAVLASLPSAAHTAISVDGATVHALGDATRIGQILRNLLDNAIRHGGPNVGVAFERDDGRVRTKVWDDGPGMPGDETHLAERLQDHRVSPDQLGLGLLIAWRLTRLMGGDLHHERDRGITTFTLDLPEAG